MSTAQPHKSAYGLSQALIDVFSPPIVAHRAPTTADKAQLGTLWIEPTDTSGTAVNSAWILTSIINNSATWVLVETGGGAGVFSSLTVNPGPTNLSTVGNGAVNIGNSTNTQAITITAGTGNIALVGAGHSIGIGNDAAANTVTVGSTSGAATTTIQGGTAGVSVATSATGTITIGSAAMTGTITLGDSTAGQTINISSTAAANTVNIVGAGATVASAVNIGTGAAAHVVTLGSTNGAASTTVQAGTEGISLSQATGRLAATPNISTAQVTTTPTFNARLGNMVVDGSGAAKIAAGATVTFVITNSFVTATSMALVTVASTEDVATVQLAITAIRLQASTMSVSIKNSGGSDTAANFYINWWVTN